MDLSWKVREAKLEISQIDFAKFSKPKHLASRTLKNNNISI